MMQCSVHDCLGNEVITPSLPRDMIELQYT